MKGLNIGMRLAVGMTTDGVQNHLIYIILSNMLLDISEEMMIIPKLKLMQI